VLQYHTRLGYFPWSSNPSKYGGIHRQLFYSPFDFDISQGDELKVNVIDRLHNTSLDLATSIVRSLVFWDAFGTLMCPNSIGMDSSKIAPPTMMVLLSSPSVPLYPTKAFYMTFLSRTNQYFTSLTSEGIDRLTSLLLGNILVSQPLQEPIL
jgi:hypothetical protein